MKNIKQQLSACLKQTAQMEREAQSLGLTSSEQVRLTALLQSAKEALAEAENMVQQEEGDGQKETNTKLPIYEVIQAMVEDAKKCLNIIK